MLFSNNKPASKALLLVASTDHDRAGGRIGERRFIFADYALTGFPHQCIKKAVSAFASGFPAVTACHDRVDINVWRGAREAG
jgi:hypothetical protein